MNEYAYSGPVMKYETCVANNWTANTRAATLRKARSNLTYRFKKENNMLANVKITLPGKIILVSGKEEANGQGVPV